MGETWKHHDSPVNFVAVPSWAEPAQVPEGAALVSAAMTALPAVADKW